MSYHRVTPFVATLSVAFALGALASSMGVLAATFTNVTAAAGITSASVPSAGAAWGDYDGDGCIDLFVSGGDNRLFKNDCDGTFTRVDGDAGITGPAKSTGSVWVDYDNDGDLDLSVVSERENTEKNALYRNNGNGTFTNVAVAAGVDDDRGATNGTWADYDNDGDLDLFVANRFGDRQGADVTDRLFRNNGDGTFTDVAQDLGIDGGDSRLTFMGSWVDYDADLDADLYVAIDFQNDRLYRNNGNGTFTDASNGAGITGPPHSMGIDVGDPNGDGCLDIGVTNNARTTGPSVVYTNTCTGAFDDLDSIPDRAVVEWGINFVDYDNDGDEDLSIVAGARIPRVGGANALLQNNGSGVFSDVTGASLVGNTDDAYGSAWADYDNDGDLDWYVANDTLGPDVLFRNNGPAGNWLRVLLHGVDSNTFGVGARVEATAGGVTQVRFIQAGMSYQSAEELSAYFGLGSQNMVAAVTVYWPSGIVDTVISVAANTTLEIIENETIFGDGFESGDLAAWSSSVP